jgi:2-polyprenyl-3-methyl-5-hydroxy-6-metoxy-1,4-benzoquinol methylase
MMRAVGSTASDTTARWNHNIHYHSVLLNRVPVGVATALDVGCGEGTLARQLRARVPHVVGLDPDAASIAQAREQSTDSEIAYVRGDFLDYPFKPESFDVITCVATLHHVDLVQGLERFDSLLRVGGVLGIVGLARSSQLRDVPYDLAGIVGGAVLRRTRPYWEHPLPTVWPPPNTYAEVRDQAERHLPGSCFCRRSLFRYTLIWRKPHSR